MHSASVQDRAGAKLVLYCLNEQYPNIGLIWADGGYANAVDAGPIGWADHELGVRRSSRRTADLEAHGGRLRTCRYRSIG